MQVLWPLSWCITRVVASQGEASKERLARKRKFEQTEYIADVLTCRIGPPGEDNLKGESGIANNTDRRGKARNLIHSWTARGEFQSNDLLLDRLLD